MILGHIINERVLFFSCDAGQSTLGQAIQTSDSSTKVGAMLKVHVCYIF